MPLDGWCVATVSFSYDVHTLVHAWLVLLVKLACTFFAQFRPNHSSTIKLATTLISFLKASHYDSGVVYVSNTWPGIESLPKLRMHME